MQKGPALPRPYQTAGIARCLFGTVGFAILTAAISALLPKKDVVLPAGVQVEGGD